VPCRPTSSSAPARAWLACSASGCSLRPGLERPEAGPLRGGAALADSLVLGKVRAKLGLHRVRHAASAAAPISRGTLDFFLSLGIPILEIYGLSETSGPGTVSVPGRFKTGAVGQPMPGLELDLAADGEIRMRGPNIFRGYRKDPAATAAALDADGWFSTGDIGVVDADGYLTITGRRKDIIIRKGENISANEIEDLLYSHPKVADVAVIGLPDPKWGESVTAVVVAKGGQALDADQLLALCREHLAGFKNPKKILLQTEPLPRTPTGKVQKFLLVERYGSQ